MRHKHFLRRLHNDTDAGIATYVIIMIGLAFMLYLFGFQSMYSQWTTNANIDGQTDIGPTDINNPDLNQGGIIETLMNPLNLLTVGIGVGGAVALLVGWFTKSTSTILTYAIPALLLIALNIFVFPINTLTVEMGSFNISGFPITGFILIFFNIFYILAVIEFIRGPTG